MVSTAARLNPSEYINKKPENWRKSIFCKQESRRFTN